MSEEANGHTASEAFARIRHLAVEAAIHFNNAEIRNNHLSGAKRNVREVAFQRRDALIYRFDAVLYHLTLLHQTQVAAEQQLMDPQDMTNGRDILVGAANKQRFLFDDVVFNCVSLFDYYGRFAGTVLQADSDLKLRWDMLYKWSKHPGAGGATNRIAGTRVAEVVIFEDQRWIKHLVEYRSRVIHYESEKADGRVEFKFSGNATGTMTANHSLRPFVPPSFLSALKIKANGEPVAVLDAAHLLVRKVFDAAEGLLVALGKELETRVPYMPPGTVLTSPTLVRRSKASFDPEEGLAGRATPPDTR